MPFQVFDPTPTGTACSGVMRAQAADDVDSISVDGLRKLEVTLTNNGSGTVTIVYRIGAEQPVTVPVEPGATSPAITGALTQFQWTYQAAGCTVSVAIPRAPTSHPAVAQRGLSPATRGAGAEPPHPLGGGTRRFAP